MILPMPTVRRSARNLRALTMETRCEPNWGGGGGGGGGWGGGTLPTAHFPTIPIPGGPIGDQGPVPCNGDPTGCGSQSQPPWWPIPPGLGAITLDVIFHTQGSAKGPRYDGSEFLSPHGPEFLARGAWARILVTGCERRHKCACLTHGKGQTSAALRQPSKPDPP